MMSVSVRRARSAARWTPTADRLAAQGLEYKRFHTTALCSPTRAALLSGRNHHTVGMGSITEIATPAPGALVAPEQCAAADVEAERYSTAQFGKCHEVPVWQSSPMGPFDAGRRVVAGSKLLRVHRRGEQPVGPGAVRRTTPVEPPATPEEGYHLTEDLADRAMSWVRQQKALMPDKPFFVYFAPGATHAPHHVPKEWADRYEGQFDDGGTWPGRDLRSTEGTRRHPPRRGAHRPARGDHGLGGHSRRAKRLMARQMEVYAGFLEQVDHEVGRLVDIDDRAVLENTIVYYIIGDNGGSAEGR